MATYLVCSRLNSQTSRFQITLNDNDQLIGNLHREISKTINVTECDFDILYAGQVLSPECSISTYSLQDRSTLYLVPKFTEPISEMNEETNVSSSHKNEVLLAIQSALMNDDYRSIVERMLTDSDTVENIIATTPGLDKDPSVLALLLKPELLTILVHPNNIDSLFQKHPSFAQAAITIATAVNEEGAKSGAASNAGALSYSMDQMSDEEEDLPGPSRPRVSGAGRNITASQLAEALQAATSASNQFNRSPAMQSRPQNEPVPSGSGTAITSDFFQQAMLEAQNASSSSVEPTSSEAALQQLRDMGITDDNVARQALAATNGDIQAALDLIFGDGFM